MKQLPQVLLVDDNPANVGLARDTVRPDLVILDLNLPKKDGRAVLVEAKADTDLRTIPVVVFSTSQSMLDIARSYELGANCYVSKPGNLDDYFLAVQSIEEFWFGFASLPRKEK